MNNYFFEDIVNKKDGFLRGPFGGALKKEIFVNKSDKTYKVYEQGVVLNKNAEIGNYYIAKEYFDKVMYKFEAKPGDILISCSGVNYGAVFELPKDATCGVINQALLRVRLNKNIVDSRYFIYLFESLIVKRIVGGTGDSTIPNFPPMNVVRKTPIELPSLDNQREIASILSALDDKIELNNKINIELEGMAKSLYDYRLVQFDFPNEEGKPYKSYGGKMVYNEVLKREIPEGWEVKRLSEIANIIMGQSPSGESFNENDEGTIFFQGSTDFGWRFPQNRVFTTAPKRFAREDDILLSVRAPVGTMNVAMNDCCIGRGLAAINSKDGFSSFLLYQMNYFKKKFDYINSVGTTFGSLTKDDLYGLEFPYPSKKVLSNFESIVSKFDKKIKINIKQNLVLAQLRDWLLPMLMNGQVKVVGQDKEDLQMMNIAAETNSEYEKQKPFTFDRKGQDDQRFEMWLSNQGLAARGDIDGGTLKEIFDAMDDEDK